MISVIIPAYNRADLIGQTLSSLLRQTLPADEIIVVDDGSTDSTAEAAKSEFSAFSRQFSGKGKLPEFKVIRQENAGPGAARNLGFAESKGEFIHFFDSDDIAAPNKHEVQVRALQEAGADIAYGPWVKGYIKDHGAGSVGHGAEVDKKRYSFEPVGHVLQQKGLPKGDLIKELLTRWSIVPQTCLFRRSIVEKAGGFPADMFVAEDQLMFLRCLLNGGKVVHSAETLSFYRLGDSSKITESDEGKSRRINDWALFLVRAANECSRREAKGARWDLSSEQAPLSWFGFRLRCWLASEALIRSGASQSSLVKRLLPWSQPYLPLAIYKASSLRDRWYGGIHRRLFGGHAKSCFRAGCLRPEQAKLFPFIKISDPK